MNNNLSHEASRADNEKDQFAMPRLRKSLILLPFDSPNNEVSSQSAPGQVENELGGSRLVPYELSIVIPTRNERDNILPLLQALSQALDGICVEILFVDDSDDDTPVVIENTARMIHSSWLHIHLEHRPQGVARTGGLATAVERGMSIAQAPYLAVIDADLQHPPAQLRTFYYEAVTRNVDLVLATRYIKDGSYDGLDGRSRKLISLSFKWLAKILFPEQLLHVSDPLGGFFLLRRSLLTGITLRPIGYKILLEILIRCQWRNLLEVPYHFHARANGTSKADTKQGIMALQHMWRLLTEVPAAGRVWKVLGIVAINCIIILTLLALSTAIAETWMTIIRTILFAFIGLGNFIVFNHLIFPATHSKTNVSNISELETGKLPVLSGLKVPVTRLPVVSHSPTSTPWAPAFRAIHDELTISLASIPTIVLPKEAAGRENVINHPTKGTVYHSSEKSFIEKIRLQVPSLVVAAVIVWIACTLPGAWLLLAVLFVGFGLLLTNTMSKQQMITMVLGVAVGLSVIDYVVWRFEVANWAGWWIAIPLLAAETLGALHALGFQYTIWPRPQPQLLCSEDPSLYPIFIFIPTVNEGVEILEPTLRGAIKTREAYLARYPHAEVTIVVCNDGLVANASNWQEKEALAKRLGVQCITRTVGGGAKAGNIEHARQQLYVTGDALLVIFDADQIAQPDFLLKTVAPFCDKTIGWVQTGQYYSNLDNPVARWADDQQAMFYNLLCPGKAAINSAFICGTNVVIRAKALDEIGGLPQDTVTEDFSASINLHARWRSLFLTDVLATGLGPMDLPSYLKQQRRWAIGTIGVLRTHWRDIFLPRRNGLSIEQRLQYFLACTHYLCGLRDLIYLLSPIFFVLFGVPAVKGSTLEIFLWHFLPYFLTSLAALWYSCRGITGLRGIIIGFGCFPVLLESLLSVILQRKVAFAVTSKQRGTLGSLNYLLVYVLFTFACVASIILVVLLRSQQHSSMLISLLWIVYSLCLLVTFLWLSFKDILFQVASNQSSKSKIVTTQEYSSRLLNREQGLRPAWNLCIAVCIAGLIFSRGSNPTPPAASTFILSQAGIQHPYFGVSLSQQLLKTRPSLVEQQLHTHVSIIGRTQDVHDFFDRHWADELAQQQERPWITLEFRVSDAHGKPPVDASLPSIINGLHDNELKRWAEDIRGYGRPVYLTFLLHVDRNWSLSSAVANGGIPQDSSRAWMHIRTIFKAAGATNVAWVWAPADPAHDEQYAPPPSAIDAILLSIISYPNTVWTDTQVALRNVETRYPTKPVLLEVSADGPSRQKAAWLTEVGRTVNAMPNIHAIIYHDGSPRGNATIAEDNQWSLFSDERSLMAMRQIVSSFTR